MKPVSPRLAAVLAIISALLASGIILVTTGVVQASGSSLVIVVGTGNKIIIKNGPSNQIVRPRRRHTRRRHH